MWDSASGKLLRTLSYDRGQYYRDAINDVAFSPDGTTVITASDDHTAKLWDTSNGAHLLTFGSEPSYGSLEPRPAGHTYWVRAVAFSADGKTIVTGGADFEAMVWDAANGMLLRTLSGHAGPVNAVAFSPDGTTIATGSGDAALGGRDYTARLWEASSGDLLLTLAGHIGQINGVAFSPDGRIVATASYDGTAKLWDASTGALLRTLTGHTAEVKAATFSPDGSTVVTGSSDGTVKFWETRTGQVTQTLVPFEAGDYAIIYADGSYIATEAARNDIFLVDGLNWSPVTVAYENEHRRVIDGVR